MAAGVLSKPGSKYGPCAVDCKHLDCAQTRTDASSECRICTKAIGYEVRFYNSAGRLVHALCLEQEIEGERAAV